MKPELRHVGNSQSPVVVIDDFLGTLDEVLDAAEALAPFPPLSNCYPGVRRVITPADERANAYVERVCGGAAPFIAGAFDDDAFNLIEASFSMVTTPADRLSPPQRAPHFDTTDQKHYALLHYLRVPQGSGTAFYRQRSTGIERVTEDNLTSFIRTAEMQAPKTAGYIRGSNDFFEEIGAVEAVPGRLVIYQGSLLHSGIIPEGMSFSADPRQGRLTANLFVRGV